MAIALDRLSQCKSIDIHAAGSTEPIERSFKRIGPRIADPVDAVAETHEPLTAGDLPGQPSRGIIGSGNRIEHVEHWSGSSAMQRPLERAQPADHRGEQPRLGRGDHPRGKGRGIEPVVGDGDEIGVERLDLLRRGRRAVQHPQEIRREAERGIGGDRRPPLAAAGDGRREDRHGGDGKHMMRPGLGVGKRGEKQPQRLDLRQAVGRGQMRRHQLERPKTRAAERRADVVLLHRFGSNIPPQKGQNGLEAPVGQAVEIVPAHDQPPGRAVDMAEHGFGGDDVLEAGRGLLDGEGGGEGGESGSCLIGHGDPHG